MEKIAWDRVLLLPSKLAKVRPAQVKLLLGPSHADEAEPPLLLDLLRLFEAASVWQDPLLHREDVDDWELEPLRGMQCHHRNVILLVVPAIDITGEGDRFEEI